MSSGVYLRLRNFKKEQKKCLYCNKFFYKKWGESWKQFDNKKCCSKKCSSKSRKGISVIYNTGRTWFKKGDNTYEKNHNWKGKDVGYAAIHMWLNSHNIKKDICDFCKNKIDKVNVKRIEFALKKGRKYSRNINDYYQLCPLCHRRYDLEWIKNKLNK